MKSSEKTREELEEKSAAVDSSRLSTVDTISSVSARCRLESLLDESLRKKNNRLKKSK